MSVHCYYYYHHYWFYYKPARMRATRSGLVLDAHASGGPAALLRAGRAGLAVAAPLTGRGGVALRSVGPKLSEAAALALALAELLRFARLALIASSSASCD